MPVSGDSGMTSRALGSELASIPRAEGKPMRHPDTRPARSLSWMALGACHGQDPELFFPIAARGPAARQIRAAKAICSGCPVRTDCLSYAVHTMPEGIWGGTTLEERYAMRRPLRLPSLDLTAQRLARSATGARAHEPG